MFDPLEEWREAGLEHSNTDFESELENSSPGTRFGVEPIEGFSDHVVRVRRVDQAMFRFNAAHLMLVDHLIDADHKGVWATDGSPSLTDWLVSRYSMSRFTARTFAQVASKLADLPCIRRVFEEGGLSWDQFRVVVKIATPETDEELSLAAPAMTPAEIKAIPRTITDKQADESQRDREVTYWFDEKQPVFEMHVKMPDVEGAAFITALTRKASQLDLDPYNGSPGFHSARLADALIQMGSETLAADGDHDRATVLVHTEINTLLGVAGSPQATLGDGTLIPSGTTITNPTLSRLVCDARIQLVIKNGTGGVIGIGRTSRTIPPWLNRLVRARDKGCRFPQCGRNLWLQVHHLKHWAHGGPTDLDNLITLCGYHHRLIHNDGWTIKGNPNTEITWITQWGTPFERHPEYTGISYIKQFHAQPRTIATPQRRTA